MKPFLHPARQPKGPNWLYCRLCDVELRKTERESHDADEQHATRLRAMQAWEDIDAATGHYRCPGPLGWYFDPGVARLENLLYDAAALQRKGPSWLTGVSLRRPR